jgi:hypothetical protein
MGAAGAGGEIVDDFSVFFTFTLFPEFLSTNRKGKSGSSLGTILIGTGASQASDVG